VDKQLKKSVLGCCHALPKYNTSTGEEDLWLDSPPVAHPLGVDETRQILVNEGIHAIRGQGSG
jgi:hypothetical protein